MGYIGVFRGKSTRRVADDEGWEADVNVFGPTSIVEDGVWPGSKDSSPRTSSLGE